jgi:hypothetical protein
MTNLKYLGMIARPNLSVEDKKGAYSLTTPSGEEYQFAGIVEVARLGGRCFWMKRVRELYGASWGYPSLPTIWE